MWPPPGKGCDLLKEWVWLVWSSESSSLLSWWEGSPCGLGESCLIEGNQEKGDELYIVEKMCGYMAYM